MYANGVSYLLKIYFDCNIFCMSSWLKIICITSVIYSFYFEFYFILKITLVSHFCHKSYIFLQTLHVIRCADITL